MKRREQRDLCRLISINKPYADLIFDGKKEIEWRKGNGLGTGKYYVYETKNKGGCGMVIGEFIVSIVKYDVNPYSASEEQIRLGCVSRGQLAMKYDAPVTALYIGSATRYDKPKELGEFKRPCGLGTGCEDCDDIYFTNCKNALTRPPQSWFYVEEL